MLLVEKPVPVPDEVTAPFWAGTAAGELRIQRCPRCRWFQHPPQPLCAACGADGIGFVPVSGRARLHSWTQVCSGARHPAFDARTPYLLGLVELVEQEGLFLYTNLPGAHPAGLRAGLALQVEFEPQNGFTLPQFRPAGP